MFMSGSLRCVQAAPDISVKSRAMAGAMDQMRGETHSRMYDMAAQQRNEALKKKRLLETKLDEQNNGFTPPT